MNENKIIDGKEYARKLRENITAEVSLHKQKYHLHPGLAVIIIGDNPASLIYVNNKQKMAIAAGMKSEKHLLEKNVSQEKLLNTIDLLNDDPSIHGILVQLPLPEHIDSLKVIERIKPEKDVDGFTKINVGLLTIGHPDAFVPCTPLGCIMMLKDIIKDLSGKVAVIVGRSNIVGKPMATLLLQQNCTTTIIHSRSKKPHLICNKADIVVAAIGKPNHLNSQWIKNDSVVIDVGINKITKNGKSKIVGDVDFAQVYDKINAITPVPGGVGPMTIACLLLNTLTAACRSKKIPSPNIGF